MIGDKRSTEALEDILIRQDRLVGERCCDVEAPTEVEVEFLEVRMQT